MSTSIIWFVLIATLAWTCRASSRTDADPRFALSSGSDSTQVAVVQCHVCYVSVHTVCYGVREVKGRGHHWRCDRCQDDPSHVVWCYTHTLVASWLAMAANCTALHVRADV
jgi:hypothetical protein